MTMMMMILMIDRTVSVELLSCYLEFKYAMSILFASVMPPPPPFNEVYRVPDAFLQCFRTAWKHAFSSVACCNATLKIQSLFRMVEVEVSGALVPDLQ